MAPDKVSSGKKDGVLDSVDVDSLHTEAEKSLQYTEVEHSLTFWSAIKLHYPAVLVREVSRFLSPFPSFLINACFLLCIELRDLLAHASLVMSKKNGC